MTHNSTSFPFAAPRVSRSATVSAVVAGAWFVFGASIGTTYLFFQSDPKLGSAVRVASACLVLYVAIVVVTVFGYLHGKYVWTRPAQWILAYACLTGLSLLWTQSSSLLSAFGYWVGFVAGLATTALLLRCDEVDTVAIAAMRGYVVATVVVAIVAWTAPGTWELRMGDQEYLHPNMIGNQFALAALCSIYLARRYSASPQWSWVTMGLVFSLVRTLSKTSIISFSVAAGLYYLKYSKLSLRGRLKIVLVAAGIILASLSFVFPYADVYAERNELETVTGRTVIWSMSYDIGAECPWLGHGLYSYKSVVPYFSDEFQASHAHNDFLQQYFSYGLIGVFLSLGIYISFYRQLRRSQGSVGLGLGYILLIYGLLHGLTEADNIELMLPSQLILLVSVWVGGTDARDRFLNG